eukprot:CAMPEP_0115654628 /NCGR_PEP_ID=MMETSP0272-20121206/43212_1 /TAXON_ID=71861 /ORGANISM="Scrippsiella trochoidea, Strain CCMP3099" /LENGTH=143 /DNA_ID=CAMNT_0003092529 /DNA_START=655 /DNA_END=1086 /DNA_ORIENTATION=-
MLNLGQWRAVQKVDVDPCWVEACCDLNDSCKRLLHLIPSGLDRRAHRPHVGRLGSIAHAAGIVSNHYNLVIFKDDEVVRLCNGDFEAVKHFLQSAQPIRGGLRRLMCLSGRRQSSKRRSGGRVVGGHWRRIPGEVVAVMLATG